MILFVGVTGACGSGKTFFCDLLAKSLTEKNISCTIINADHYYKDHSHLSRNQLKITNFCSPDKIDFELLEEHLDRLAKGFTVERPCYNIKNSTREKYTVNIQPAPVIILEGLLIFKSLKIRNLCNFKIFIDLKLDLCLARRLLRDHYERKQPFEIILNNYETMICPAFFQYTRCDRNYSNLILKTDNDIRQALNELPNILTLSIESMNLSHHTTPLYAKL